MPPQDAIPLSRLTRVGLSLDTWGPEKTWTLGLRTATVLLGTTLLVYGAMPAQFQQGLSVFRALEWGAVSAVVIRVAECSRWFFTVVQATRDLHRRW